MPLPRRSLAAQILARLPRLTRPARAARLTRFTRLTRPARAARRGGRPPAVGLVAAVGLLALAGAGCNEHEQVDLAFEARPGSRITYEIVVESTVVTTLLGPPEETTERIELTATEEVLASGDEGVSLELTIGREGARPQVLALRHDPETGVARVETVEGLSVEALGELEPSRFVLLASGLLPDGARRPGGTWEIDRRLDLPEGERRLTGRGRLAALRRRGDHEVARVETDVRLPVDRSMTLPDGRVRIRGDERTRATIEYRLADGTMERAESVTTGEFDLTVTPPDDRASVPVRGSLEVRVEATTERVAGP